MVADFNKDGDQDLAIAGTAGVSVRLGNGDGTFANPVIYGPANAHTSIATSDLNGDGHLDLVAAVSSGNPRVFMGNGDGTFVNGAAISTAVAAHEIAIADMNSDGVPDIVATWATNNSVHLLPGVGNGSFSPAITLNFGDGGAVGPLVLADLDLDGLRDIAVIGGSNTVRVRKGAGGGSFGPVTNYSVAANPARLVVGDFNADGRPDLVSSHPGEKAVSVLIGTDGGTFEAAATYTSQIAMRFLAVGDFNSDGRQDIATTSSVTNESFVALLAGRGDGTFYNAAKPGGGWGLLVVGDFNNDGFQDLVTKKPGNTSLNLLIKGCPRVAFDFDGNGRANPTVWRPSNNWWYVRQDTGGWV